MVAKKKIAKANGTAKVSESTTDEDGFLCLKGDQLWKWRALEAEHRAANVELSMVSQRIQMEIAKHPELPTLLAKQKEMLSTISISHAELVNVQAEIEKAFGVSLKECAFDDKTGRLYNLTADGQRTAVKPSKKRRRVGHGIA